MLIFEHGKLAFFNRFVRRRRLAVEGSFINRRGVNESSPFFVCMKLGGFLESGLLGEACCGRSRLAGEGR